MSVDEKSGNPPAPLLTVTASLLDDMGVEAAYQAAKGEILTVCAEQGYAFDDREGVKIASPREFRERFPGNDETFPDNGRFVFYHETRKVAQ